MMSRTSTATYAGRASSMRRLRRRAAAAHPTQPFCRTNGCASFLDVDATKRIATCPICGSTQRLRPQARAH
jgi:hypothetical protein